MRNTVAFIEEHSRERINLDELPKIIYQFLSSCETLLPELENEIAPH